MISLRSMLLVLAGFLGCISQTRAQTDTLNNEVFGFFLTVPLEFPVIDTDAFNQQLTRFGMPVLRHPTANIGVGLQLHSNRFITAFSFNKTTKKSDKETYLREVEYRSTALSVGYDVLKNPWYSVYPYLGFKGAGLNYLYREKLPTDASFEEYLQSDLKYAEITNSRGHLDLGIGVSHQSFYLVNLRFGYLVPLEKVRWNINNNETTLSKAPSVNYPFYFSLTIGFGHLFSEQQQRRR